MLLLTGRAKARHHRSFLMRVKPTATGRRLLGRHHRAVHLRVVVHFKPEGRAKAYSVVRKVTLPGT